MGTETNTATPVADAGNFSPAAKRHEFWVSDDEEDALRKAKITLKRLGELTKVAPGQYVEGAIKFGIYNAALRITWRTASEEETASLGKVQRAMQGTTLILEADCPAARDAATRDTAANSAIERFEEAYHHFDNPDFKPDRLGLLPMTVIGVVVFLVLVGYLLLRTPFMQHLLPKHALTIKASPAPDASPDASPSPEDTPAPQ